MSNSKTHVVYELLRRGLLDKSEILDGGITVADSTESAPQRPRNAARAAGSPREGSHPDAAALDSDADARGGDLRARAAAEVHWRRSRC